MHITTCALQMASVATLLASTWACANGDDVCKQAYNANALNPSALVFKQEFKIQGITPNWSILEGPVWKDGALYMNHIGIKYFAELENPWQSQLNNPSDLIKYENGKITTMAARYGANGMALDTNNQLITARHLDGSITAFDSKKILAAQYNGARFNAPNDLIISKAGIIYFTDPNWQASEPTRPQAAERAYVVDKQGGITAITDGVNIEKPNGIYLSKNERTLFIGGANGLFSLKINANGSVDTDSLQPQLPGIIPHTDGLSRDCAGNLWITSNGAVHVAKVTGTNNTLSYVGSAALPLVTNLAFGSPDGKTLFATVMGEQVSLWSTRVDIPGMPY